MQTRNVIDDKYTRGGYVEPIPHCHEGLAFLYRPMLPEQVEDLLAALDRATPGRASIAVVGDVLSRQLVSWSETQELSAKNIMRLPYGLFARVRGIVEGRQASDLPPDYGRGDLAEFIKAILDQSNGKAPGQEQLAADQKN